MNILVIIPARGGSKGIPRKNLRALNNKPLIYYSIQCALKSKYCTDVYVSSEDNEILSISKKIGAKTHNRNNSLSQDATTLDPVIFSAFQDISKKEKEYKIVVTLQPTSPLLTPQSLDQAIEIMLENNTIDTVIAAKDNTHLSWTTENSKFIPTYKKRVNRQYLRPSFTETGGFIITKSTIITKNNRIGNNVELYILKHGESVDIDTYEDWNICEYYLRKKKILFVVSGNSDIGLGHVYNTLSIANDILDHQVLFLVDKKSALAKEKIASKNYQVLQQKYQNLSTDILEINPDIVINDILDTTQEYIISLKNKGITVINFEDLGEGTKVADLVVNAIYPESKKLPNHYFGEKYFILRDEFLLTSSVAIKPIVSNILISFGGVDPQNLTKKVLVSIYEYCVAHNITINIITGLGYRQHDSLKAFERIIYHENISNISDHIINADLIFTSAGRTVYEVAALSRPSIVLAQNTREMTHLFANEKNGFIHLGMGLHATSELILNNFIKLLKNYELRKEYSQRMKAVDLRSGRMKVQKIIRKVINDV